jgi:hypothetical protein
MNGTFWRLMRDKGLLKYDAGQNRTLYSLRHRCATFKLLRGAKNSYAIKKMGDSATMEADRLA